MYGSLFQDDEFDDTSPGLWKAGMVICKVRSEYKWGKRLRPVRTSEPNLFCFTAVTKLKTKMIQLARMQKKFMASLDHPIKVSQVSNFTHGEH